MPDENDRPLTEEEMALARRGEALISAATADVQAPQSLREAIERDRERAAARGRAPFWRRRRIGVAAGAAAATLVVVGVGLETLGDESEPSLDTVVAAAKLDPTKPAPAPAGGSPPVIDARVGNLQFPDWRKKFGWDAVGRRSDELSGRGVTTVYYRNPKGARLGYAVVSGDELDDRPPGRTVTRNGNTYNVSTSAGRTITTWTQQGHTCVIVAPASVPRKTLVDLAASRDV